MTVNEPPKPPKLTVVKPPPLLLVAARGPLVIKLRAAHKRNYGPKPRRITQFLTLHCTEGHEGLRKDDDVAAMFARADLAKPRSCHYVNDSDSVTRCLDEMAVGWHCGTTGNSRSIGIEFCGRARQSQAEWLDELSRPMLAIGARLIREICDRHGLPLNFLDAAALSAGLRGVTTHAEVSKAWHESTHTDPGPNFPIEMLLSAARRAA